MKGVYIFLAEGFEDMEALATNDVLHRAGIPVRTVSITASREVVSSRGVKVSSDMCFDSLDTSPQGTTDKDFMIFPGGMPGSVNLSSCAPLMSLMQSHYDEGGSLAAICAAPGLVIGSLRDLSGIEFTCFDGYEDIPCGKGAEFVPKAVMNSGRIITGRSAGHSVEFGLEIVKKLAPLKYDEVEYGLNLECIE